VRSPGRLPGGQEFVDDRVQLLLRRFPRLEQIPVDVDHTLIAWIAASVSAYAVNSARRASGKRSIACSRNSMPFMCGIR